MMLGDSYKDLCRPHKGYLFLVTYGRSGSTLTQHYLNSIPGYCIRGENGNILLPLCRAINILFRENFVWRRDSISLPDNERAPFLRNIIGRSVDPWFGAEMTNPDTFALSILDVFVREVLRLPEGVRVGGFKEIGWTNDIGFFSPILESIERYFPNPLFIFQTRGYEAVARSGWWKGKPIEEVKNYVESADLAFQEFSKGRENCFHLRYEEYADGIRVLERLTTEFLHEEFDARTAENILSEQLTHLK